MNNGEQTKRENDDRWLLLRAKVQEEKIKTAFRLFRGDGIEPILIKGWAAAKEYPERHRRVFSDIDLAVSPDVYKKSLDLIAGEAGGKLNIDLHCGLRHLDTLEWDKLFLNSKVELVDDAEFRILCPEDHLRVLCVHWLTDGGGYKERLLDIFYLLKNHADSFDWEKCFEPLNENRRDWIIKTVTLVSRYHNLGDLSLPFVVAEDTIPGWFLKALEKEWASETRLNPIHLVLGNRVELWRQLKRRISPNPIQSTIIMEGKFDNSSRLYYQAGSILKRLKPSLKRTLLLLKSEFATKFKKNG